MKKFKIILFLFLFLCKADFANCLSLVPQGPHRLYIGPECYHLKREKEGGSQQKGWLYGGYGAYERRRHGGLYWALDGYYAYGTLNGKTAMGSTLKSQMTEYEVEGRLGYSFCKKKWKKLTFIPYGGYGYFNSHNDFKKPSPLIYTFKDDLYYGSAGFEISFFPRTCLECGLNFQAKYMTEGKSRIDEDPNKGKLKMLMNNKTQYEADLLFRYYSHFKNRNIVALVVPFYQFRHYGGRINSPFDLLETKFQIYGLRFLLNVSF